MNKQTFLEKYMIDAKAEPMFGHVTLRLPTPSGFNQSISWTITGTKNWDRKKFISMVKTMLGSSVQYQKPNPNATMRPTGSVPWQVLVKSPSKTVTVTMPKTSRETPESLVKAQFKSMLNKAEWSVGLVDKDGKSLP